MIDRRLRPYKDRLAEPCLVVLSTAGVSASTLTWFGLAAAAISALAAWLGSSSWGPLVAVGAWWMSRIADGLDGPLARRHGRATNIGGYHDIVADTISYAWVPLGAAAGVGTARVWILAAVLLASFYVNSVSWLYLSALREKVGAGASARGESTSVTMPVGLVEGAETIVLYSIFLLFPATTVWVFGIMAALVMITVGQRVFLSRQVLR